MAAAVPPGGGAAVVGGEEPRRRAGAPHRRRGEQIGPRRRRHDLQLAALVRRRPVHARDGEHADVPVLPALREMARVEDDRRGRADVGIRSVELVGVRRRVVPEHAACVGREAEHRVAPVRRPVPRCVAGGNEQIARRRVDDGAGAAPDRGVARVACARDEQAAAIRAERVPHVQQLAARTVDDGHVALIGRRVADVSAGGRDHVAVGVVQRGRDLLARSQPRDRGAPGGVAARCRELVDATAW